MDVSNIDVCDIGPNISVVKGLKADSASPTDTWIVSFKKPYRVSDTIEAKSGFMKLHICPSTLESTYDDWEKSALKGLEYEGKLYRDVTNQLVKQRVCPFYVLNLGTSEQCTFANLVAMLKGHLPDVKSDDVEKVLVRNLAILYKQGDNRPAISNASIKGLPVSRGLETKLKNELRYDVILNEDMGKAVKLGDFVKERGLEFFDTELWTLLFLVSVSCYSMHLAGMVHNDLHDGNIYVVKLDSPRTILYTVNQNTYVVKTQYIPYLYDFDRAYSKEIGDNPLLAAKTNRQGYCSWYSQCNKAEYSNQDIVKIFCYLYKKFPAMQSIIVELLSKSKMAEKILMVLYETDSSRYGDSNGGRCFMEIESSKRFRGVPTSYFSKFKPAESIIECIYRDYLLPEKWYTESLDKISRDNVYCAKKEFFGKNGKLNVTKQQEYIGSVEKCMK